jgi:RNA polymerase sigma-70 factor (ECF subfamily)
MASKRSQGTDAASGTTPAADDGLWTDLLLKAQKGDEAALVRLFAEAEPVIWRLAYALLGDPHEADEVVNETFLKLWKKLATYDPERGASGRTWVYLIAERRARDHRRKIERRRKHEVSGLPRPSNDSEGDSPFDPPDRDNLAPPDAADLPYRRAMLRRALAKLRLPDRRILELYHLDGHSYDEIARQMGISIKAVGPRLTRARDRLARQLPAGQI